MAGSAAVPGVDPSRVNTPDELAACLDGLRRRRGLSYEAMEKAAAKLPSRSGGSRPEPLSKSTVGEIVTGKRLPAKGKLLSFLAVCEVAPADLAQWLAAWERARTADLARPVGGVRVRDARPRLLGVHAAIQVEGKKVPGELPVYVPRDIDDGLRAELAADAQRGCFVLLIGGSSVGKTRTLYEAVMAALPDWWLVHPAGPGEVAALAAAPTPRTVVWLNELQDYLDGEHGLDGAVVRALLNVPHPAVIIGTLWPERYATYTTVPEPGAPDPHRRERQVLDLAEVVRIAPAFSEAEQDRARAAAARDPRLRVALDAAGYGLTQTLAAAPQLVARWEDAQTASPYAWTVLTAALDMARLGARAPLSADLLRAAAPDYCTSQQLAEAPANWFEQALAYATTKLRGAAAALTPAGAGMGKVAGYTAADYLIQHASRERRYARLPASTWDALVSHVRDPDDAARLADSASNRLLYRYATSLYQRAANAGDRYAALQLGGLLERRGDLDGAELILRARADVGDGFAAERLAELLADRGDLDGLRARADANEDAAERLADLLAGRGNLDELRARADVGDRYAAEQLADLLADRGDPDGAEQILRSRVNAGDEDAAVRLAGLLADRGDLDEAEQILRARADANEDAAERLADLLADRGDLDELRSRANARDDYAAELLAYCGDQEGAEQILRARANANEDATWRLARLLAQRDDLDGLRALADAGEWYVVRELADLLAQRDDLDGLRALANAGDRYAVSLLAKRGDPDGAEQILRSRVNAGDEDAAVRLAGLLADGGDLDEAEQILRARADAGDWRAAGPLADLLIKQGRGEEAERLRRFGLNPDGSIARA